MMMPNICFCGNTEPLLLFLPSTRFYENKNCETEIKLNSKQQFTRSIQWLQFFSSSFGAEIIIKNVLFMVSNFQLNVLPMENLT
jgi:hypothetical protein